MDHQNIKKITIQMFTKLFTLLLIIYYLYYLYFILPII